MAAGIRNATSNAVVLTAGTGTEAFTSQSGDIYLFLAMTFSSGSAVTAVTYNGNAMADLTSGGLTTGSSHEISVWEYLLDPADLGANSFSITGSAGITLRAMSVALTGVATSGHGTVQTDRDTWGSTDSVTDATGSVGDILIGALVHDYAGDTLSIDDTSIFDNQQSEGLTQTRAAMGYVIHAAASATLNSTAGGSQREAIVGKRYAVAAAGGGSGETQRSYPRGAGRGINRGAMLPRGRRDIWSEKNGIYRRDDRLVGPDGRPLRRAA